MSHKISPEEVEHFRKSELTEELCGSFGKGEDKMLRFRYSIGSGVVTWEVWHQRKLVLETGFLSHAVDEYNKL